MAYICPKTPCYSVQRYWHSLPVLEKKSSAENPIAPPVRTQRKLYQGIPKMSGDMSSKANRELSKGVGPGESSRLKPGILASVETCQGKVAVCHEVKVRSPGSGHLLGYFFTCYDKSSEKRLRSAVVGKSVVDFVSSATSKGR